MQPARLDQMDPFPSLKFRGGSTDMDQDVIRIWISYGSEEILVGWPTKDPHTTGSLQVLGSHCPGRPINRRVTGRGATERHDQAWDASGCVSFQGNLGRWTLWPDSGTLLRINVTLLMFLLPQSSSGSLQPKALLFTMPTSHPN